MIVLLDEHSANVTKMDSVINVINDLYSLLFSILFSFFFFAITIKICDSVCWAVERRV